MLFSSELWVCLPELSTKRWASRQFDKTKRASENSEALFSVRYFDQTAL